MINILEVVVGAQFGSEAKGHVVQRLTERAIANGRTPQVLRVAGPNAGHTGYDINGNRWALRQVPVAAVVPGRMCLGIVAGSEIDFPVLEDELIRLREAGLLQDKTIWIHPEVTLISNRHKTLENGEPHHPGQALDNMVERIGSTGKGIGAARAERIMRVPGIRLADRTDLIRQLEYAYNVEVVDTTGRWWHTIIEGTQGYGLGLHAGYYPQCTSSNCRAIDFMAMAGINPSTYSDVTTWLVARMFPIRVAGNSGPLYEETTWEALGLPDEWTTVTNKVRRVGMPDWDLVRRAIVANGGGPTMRVALTMVDQMFDGLRNSSFDQVTQTSPMYALRILEVIANIEDTINAKIGLITTGPNTAHWME